jgi:hypothetical protein
MGAVDRTAAGLRRANRALLGRAVIWGRKSLEAAKKKGAGDERE